MFESISMSTNKSIDDFLNTKINFHTNYQIFENTFKSLLITKNGRKCYVLDILTKTQKSKFLQLYGTSGGSTIYSNEFCNDNKYRAELWSHRFVIIWTLN